ncbi:hypothetical protein FZC75_04070 [Sutcliffiella horikoshii]|uniref:Uncharacterized protein n=1 Tax=Sutcliffiella horikoshii TaxID=79883 RepID=A0A5D4TDZ3_9BACI|nr:hypothetical protein FZC75_04070 [Sutcliffiella horikoshii]
MKQHITELTESSINVTFTQFPAVDWSKWRRLQQGSKGRLRPLKRWEEAQAPSRGKRSHLRKGTAAS